MREIAAIGLSVRSRVTMHGFALNVNPNLEHFSHINPCGFPDRRAASMAKLLGHTPLMDAVMNSIINKFSEVFSITMQGCSEKAARYSMAWHKIDEVFA